MLASTLSGVIASDSTIKADSTAVTDTSGNAVFEDLEIGLYLIMGEVYHGKYAYYTPQNFMVSLPELTDDDLWNYDISAEIKWEKRLKDDNISLKALKVWSDGATNLHSNDSVTVELYKDGSLYDTQILGKDNNWSFKWDNLYGGAFWTINEKSIKGYTATVERKEDCFVITNSPTEPINTRPTLPQTGLLWWPVPMLTAGGIMLILIGIYVKRKGEKQ